MLRADQSCASSLTRLRTPDLQAAQLSAMKGEGERRAAKPEQATVAASSNPCTIIIVQHNDTISTISDASNTVDKHSTSRDSDSTRTNYSTQYAQN
jgi:hypothetical protein